MEEQLKILEPMIGKYLSYIFFQRIQQKPFPKHKSELFAYEKFCLAFNGAKATAEYFFTIEPLYIVFENHHNPFKFRIREENIFEPRQSFGERLKSGYNSTIEIDFKIGSIYFYEDDLRWNVTPDFSYINEINSKDIVGSTIIINDETGLRNIWINTYKSFDEQAENETRVRFQFGNIFTDHNLYNNKRMKFLAKIGNAPENK